MEWAAAPVAVAENCHPIQASAQGQIGFNRAGRNARVKIVDARSATHRFALRLRRLPVARPVDPKCSGPYGVGAKRR
jgi:hypothetical protein